jgi:hypothetical protein
MHDHFDTCPIFSDIFSMNQYTCLFVEVERMVQNFDTYSFAKIKNYTCEAKDVINLLF